MAKKDGTTPVYVAAQNGHHKMVQTLVHVGADVNLAKKDGTAPVYVAAQNRHPEIVETIEKHKIKLNKIELNYTILLTIRLIQKMDTNSLLLLLTE